ncbi:DUF190 domain-containing protein [Pseudomonas sp. sp1636]|uniref:DUF190 domain-containing protein n=1 Tax=Pseudomonas sp. sp1636 TaxID=3036707 RepID=UPI0025A6125B|nr:DUF190 domain-containing protein [Pseudomonas sp. sp1636]MDM8349631.1 DUF190 domain-containing protein [Pseudomonas sp. sp1636]
MQGYQVTFFTQQNRRHRGKMLADWLVTLAKEMHLPGATLVSAIEGFGHTGRLHSYHFFELADQPMEVALVLSEEECQRLFERLQQEDLALFYVKTPAEYGTLGKQAGADTAG